MDADISVIIPVYHIEWKKLCRSVDAVLTQTFTGTIEVILSFDGRNEALESQCRDYYSRADNIIYLINEHHGVSYARNCAIKVATGKYLMFCDADDVFSQTICADAFAAAEKANADMVIWNYVCVYGTKMVANRLYASEWLMEKPEADVLLYSNICKKFDSKLLSNVSFGIGGVWNRLYRTECIRQASVEFPENLHLSEDIVFNLYALDACMRVQYINRDGYFYYQSENSSSNRYRANEIEQNTSFLNALDAFRIEKLALKAYENSRFQRAQNVIAINSLMRALGNGFFSQESGKSIWKRRREFLQIVRAEPYYCAIQQSRVCDFTAKQRVSYIVLRMKAWPIIGLLTFVSQKIKMRGNGK